MADQQRVMRPLDDLINPSEPAYPLLKQWAADAVRPVEFLPPSANRADALLQTQVTTRSLMGAIVYETGGILIDNGWLRILGSGHPKLTRTVPAWNQSRANGFYLIADDAVGGFFAINGGALGTDTGNVYYFAPESLRWEPLELGYSDFLVASFSPKLDDFYKPIRWSTWQCEIANLHGDRCFFFAPPPWTKEGKPPAAPYADVPVEEAWDLQMDFRRQLGS